VPIVLKSGSLNPLEPHGPVKACNWIALPLPSLCSGTWRRVVWAAATYASQEVASSILRLCDTADCIKTSAFVYRNTWPYFPIYLLTILDENESELNTEYVPPSKHTPSHLLQGRQYTYNVTLRGVRATLLQWKSNKYYIFSVCVCSLRYPAWNAHAPYCHLWPARLYYIFPHYLIKRHYFLENVVEHKMCVLYFSTAFGRRNPPIISRTEQHRSTSTPRPCRTLCFSNPLHGTTTPAGHTGTPNTYTYDHQHISPRPLPQPTGTLINLTLFRYRQI
jgi:hypothetical protein